MSNTPTLDKLRSPHDLRTLNLDELEILAEEIRMRITDVVDVRGGHLASSLGVVELSIALHRAFDFEYDRLIFDVGHQCYAHKLLTGRDDKFDTLRSEDGLSGFPQPSESPYDLFHTGHASTSISVALGMAEADLAKGEKRHSVAVIGDGSISGGLAFEALNHAGHLKTNLTVILNDNEMSISKTVGALSRHLSRVRLDPSYNNLRTSVLNTLERFPFLSDISSRLLDGLRHAITSGGLFQDLGFRYIGPFDGHDLPTLEAELRDAKKLEGPVLLHVCTQKGRGYGPAEGDPAKFHSAAQFKVRNTTFKADAPKAEGKAEDKDGKKSLAPKSISYTRAFSDALVELGNKDDSVIAVTAAMADGTGIENCRASWPERVYDVGISEQHAVTFAAGLARAGMKPAVAMYSTFLQRAYDSVFHDICLQQDIGVVLCVDRGGLVGSDGPTHHGIYDIASLRTFPGMVLAAPRDGRDVPKLLKWAIESGKPVAIRYPRATVPMPIGEDTEIELGRSEVLIQGEDIAILAYGAMVSEALAATELLAKDGIKPTLVDARFAKPLDEKLIIKLAKTHDQIVTVEEGALIGGFGAGVLEFVNSSGLDIKLKRLGIADKFIHHATRDAQLAECGIDGASIAEVVRKLGAK